MTATGTSRTALNPEPSQETTSHHGARQQRRPPEQTRRKPMQHLKSAGLPRHMPRSHAGSGERPPC